MPENLTAIAALAPTIAMLGCFACAIGGGVLLAKGTDRRKGWLLLVMATILLGNVLVWTM